MKYAKLIWKNATRNKRRAVLTVLSIAVAILAVSVLGAVLHAFRAGVEMADESRLVMRNAVSIIFPLPISYANRIGGTKGVSAVTWGNWFGGVFRDDKKNFFPKFAVDAESYFPMYPEYQIAEAQYRDFLADRKGCIVGLKLAERFDLRVGQTIPIVGDIYPGTWEFNIRAIYTGAKKGTDETILFFHWKYLDETIPRLMQGQAGFYILQLESASEAGRVAKAIDSEYENSPEQTLTESEKAFNMEFVNMMGNVGLLVRSIGAAVIFAILLVAANTMAMAARERTTELAVMKTLGFPSRTLGALVFAEGLLLSLAGWAVGSVLAGWVCSGIQKSFANFFPVFYVKTEIVLLSLGVAVLTGTVASIFPVAHAVRTSIVKAMREVA